MAPRGRGRGTGRGGRGGQSTHHSNGETNPSGSKLMVDVRLSNPEAVKEIAKSYPNLSHLDDTIGVYKEVIHVAFRGKAVTLDSKKLLVRWKELPEGPNVGVLTFIEQNEEKSVKAFQKIMPLINPHTWMQYKARPYTPFLWSFQPQTMTIAENQAYVDCVASFMASKLKQSLKSPHFCDWYGGFRAVIDVFNYNLEEDLEDYRFTTWFWKGLDAGEFGICCIEKSTGRRLSLDEVKELIRPDDEFLHDDTSTEESSSSESETSSLSAESLHSNLITHRYDALQLEEVASISTDEESVHILKRRSGTSHSGRVSIASDTSDSSFTELYSFHAELYNMPIAIQYLEYYESTMDGLIEQELYAPINSPAQEIQWLAWLFQVCVACTQLQTKLRLTHNDLHTCNILWKKTDVEFLFYLDSKGRQWKIPTFGYIFSIIDYGRAIFTINNFTIISSDYNDGNDAAGMYNFGPDEDPDLPRVGPNKSFDLCRLCCSLLRGLFPKNPASKEKGAVLTKEGTWILRETNHPLFNLLWSWLKMKTGENVLEFEDGAEKFPGFDLYAEIAEKVCDAVPESQLGKPVFQQWSINIPPPDHAVFVPM
jgi:hypothetical protein